jgi:flavin reductase
MPAIDPLTFRSCLGRFATGVTVVSYRAGDERRGATVNAFTSVSLDPPLILISLARTARSCELLRDNPFCVNVLSAAQVGIALTFAGRPSAAGHEWIDGLHAPRLAKSHAWLECTPWRSYDAGDHVLFLGEVQDLSFDDSEPLLFYSGAFHRRGDDLDEAGRSRRFAGRRAVPLPQAMLGFPEELVAGWA